MLLVLMPATPSTCLYYFDVQAAIVEMLTRRCILHGNGEGFPASAAMDC